MRVYLCGPINGCTDEECKDWRAFAKAKLPDTLNPMSRDHRGVEDAAFREIVEQDKADIDASDVLLVSYAKPSVGTSMEILYAWERGKRVVVSCAPSAVVSPWLRYHASVIVYSLAEAIEACE